jgi:hypothetical protein
MLARPEHNSIATRARIRFGRSIGIDRHQRLIAGCRLGQRNPRRLIIGEAREDFTRNLVRIVAIVSFDLYRCDHEKRGTPKHAPCRILKTFARIGLVKPSERRLQMQVLQVLLVRQELQEPLVLQERLESQALAEQSRSSQPYRH